MKKLEDKFREFKKNNFPNNSLENIQLQEIFTDLVLYDSQIAGAIDKILKKQAINKDDLVYDLNLEKKIQENLNKGELALSYLDYLQKIKDLILIAREYA